MQLRYVFSELGQGLRRNLSMHIAVILTLFVSLTLVGLGVLLNQQADKAAQHWGSQLQITVWLCKDRDQNPACLGEVTDAQKAAISKVIEDNPEVADFHFESKDEAFEKLQETYVGKFDGPNSIITADDMPQSVWIELKDPEQFEGITSAVVGLDGVSGIRDARDTLESLGFQRQTSVDPFPEERPLRLGTIEHDGTTFRLHVHVIAADDAEAAELRAFRDRLRADPALLEEYVASKQAAFANGPELLAAEPRHARQSVPVEVAIDEVGPLALKLDVLVPVVRCLEVCGRIPDLRNRRIPGVIFVAHCDAVHFGRRCELY